MDTSQIRIIIMASAAGDVLPPREIDELASRISEWMDGKALNIETIMLEIERLMCERGRDEL